MRKGTSVRNLPDFMDGTGNWVKSYSPDYLVEYTTRAGQLWKNINSRCRYGGAYQDIQPTYVGVTNDFTSFQEFAEWCQTQYGYMNKETNGRFWQLDKDLKVAGNNAYTKNACLFVPSMVNNLLIRRQIDRGEHPLGVSWNKICLKFQARCSDGTGRVKHLGYFDCEYEAHRAWQEYKIGLIKRLCQNDLEVASHKELVHCLLGKASKIECDLAEGNQTV